MLAMILLLSANCVFVGPEAFDEGGAEWCKVGIFEQVKVEVDEEQTNFDLELHLNAEGITAFSMDPEKFTLFFAEIVGTYAQMGVTANVSFHYGEDQIAHCFPDWEEKSTVCVSDD